MITFTAQIQAANDLLGETPETLEARTVPELREIAKTLNITGCYRMNKAKIVAACSAEIEKLEAMMAAAGVQVEKSQAAVVALKAEGGHVPIAEVVGKVYQRLRQILKETQGFEAIKDKVASLAATVARTELREHEVSTAIKTRRPQIKKGLVDTAYANEGMMQQDMLDIIDVFYASLKAYQREDTVTLNRDYAVKTQAKNEDKKAISVAPLVAECQAVLDAVVNGEHPHWTKVSIALALGTGRRMVELHALGSLTVTGECEMFFQGQAKTRGAEGTKGDYSIPTLYPAAQLKVAHEYLIGQERTLDRQAQLDNPRAVNKAYGMALSRAMSGKICTYKELRAIYAELMWAMHQTGSREKHTYYSEILGHTNMHGASNSTYTSYMVFNITDTDEVLELLG